MLERVGESEEESILVMVQKLTFTAAGRMRKTEKGSSHSTKYTGTQKNRNNSQLKLASTDD